jgi:hypothetical protein
MRANFISSSMLDPIAADCAANNEPDLTEILRKSDGSLSERHGANTHTETERVFYYWSGGRGGGSVLTSVPSSSADLLHGSSGSGGGILMTVLKFVIGLIVLGILIGLLGHLPVVGGIFRGIGSLLSHIPIIGGFFG